MGVTSKSGVTLIPSLPKAALNKYTFFPFLNPRKFYLTLRLGFCMIFYVGAN